MSNSMFSMSFVTDTEVVDLNCSAVSTKVYQPSAFFKQSIDRSSLVISGFTDMSGVAASLNLFDSGSLAFDIFTNRGLGLDRLVCTN